MIAGETQLLLSKSPPAEDYFFSSKKDLVRPEAPPAPKTGRGRELVNKIGQTVKNLGGFESIGRTVDQLSGLGGRSSSEPMPASTRERLLFEQADREQALQEEKKRKNKVLLWRIAGFGALAVMVGLAVWMTLQNKAPVASP